jgi:prepilin-type processing-associated H-X9-DG protein
MPTGPKTVGEKSLGISFKDIADGSSNTLLVVEACGAQIIWTEPRDINVASQPTGINLNGAQRGQSKGWLSSYHAGGTQVLLADGSVRFIPANTDPSVLNGLATIDGREKIDDF